MYTVNKGPSKLVAKTRGGLSQNFEKIETIRQISKKCAENNEINEITMPRPVFQPTRKTYHQNHHLREQLNAQEEVHSPQHEELVKFIRDSWNMVAPPPPPYDTLYEDNNTSIKTTNNNYIINSLESTSTSPSSGTIEMIPLPKGVAIYYDDPPSPALKDFGAFDLESYWGRRLFNNITKTL